MVMLATRPDMQAGQYIPSYSTPYDSPVTRRVLMGIQELRLRIKDVINGVADKTMHVVFTRRGEPVAVLVDMDWYRQASEAIGDPLDFEAAPRRDRKTQSTSGGEEPGSG